MEVGDLLKVTIVGSDSKATLLNVRHYLVSSKTGGGASLAACANAVYNILGADYAAAFSDLITLGAVRAQQIMANGNPVSEDIPGDAVTPLTGSLSGDPMPNLIAGLLSLRTGTAGRRNRGRFYCWYPNEASNDTDGNPTAGYQALIAQVSIDLKTVLSAGGGGNTNGLTPIVLSTVGGTYLQVNDVYVRTAWATMRSRRPGHGI